MSQLAGRPRLNVRRVPLDTQAASAGWGALALAGLVVALTALRGLRQAPPAGTAVRVALEFPDALVAGVVAMITLAGLVMLGALFGRRRPRRRPGEEEFELYQEPPKVSPWVVALLPLIGLVPLGLLIVLLWSGWAPEFGSRASGRPSTLGGTLPPVPQVIDRLAVSVPAFTGAMWSVAVLAGVASAGFAAWILLMDRLTMGWATRPVDNPEREPLMEAVDAGLDDLRQQPDPRQAIIACYRRFEQWTARSGLRRAPWTTHTEFTRAALARFALPPDALQMLTRLFERSRFSHREVRATDRDAALDALVAIRSELQAAQPPTSDAPAA
jgi:hypothetical protein